VDILRYFTDLQGFISNIGRRAALATAGVIEVWVAHG